MDLSKTAEINKDFAASEVTTAASPGLVIQK